MGSRQITSLLSASGTLLTSPGSYPPGGDRVARIWEKVAKPGACLVVGHLTPDRDVVAMALAEPGRAEHGAGVVIPGYGHESMVFVHPDMWGRGIGGQLLQGLHERASARGWSRTTLWTRASNARSTPVPKPGIPSVRPRDHTWRRWPHPPARASSTLTRVVRWSIVPLERQLLAGRSNSSRIEGNAGSRKPAD